MFYKFDREITFNDIKKFNYPNQRIGVIIHIENDEGKILLQQRGPKSSDEQGLYEDVGGKYETKDATFKDTIMSSPQLGLTPSNTRLAPSISLLFSGNILCSVRISL